MQLTGGMAVVLSSWETAPCHAASCWKGRETQQGGGGSRSLGVVMQVLQEGNNDKP